MPKYLDEFEANFEANYAVLFSGDDVDHDQALAAYDSLSAEASQTVGGMREKWQENALNNLSEVVVRANVMLMDADDKGMIVPPLTSEERDRIAGEHFALKRNMESKPSSAKNTKPTDLRLIPTHLPKG